MNVKILKKGDVLYFHCPSCECFFVEGVKKTPLATAGVWDPTRQQNGTYMACPCCDEQVLGFREKNPLRAKEKEVKADG